MTKCPHPKKEAFTTKLAAINGALRRSKRLGIPMNTYRCVCGKWHTTHNTPRWSRT